MTPTAARRLAYRVARRQGLDRDRARHLVTTRMHPEQAARYAPADLRFAAQIAALRELNTLEADRVAAYRGALGAWNTGHGWTDWHVIASPEAVVTACGLELPTTGRKSVRISDGTVNPDEVCHNCARALVQ